MKVKNGQPDGLAEFFDEDNLITEMGGKKAFDFRDWIREQLVLEGVDASKVVQVQKATEKKTANEEPDNLVLQALEDEVR